jgi:nitroimidazol reductase NimA-like FMN-containing flavoprotein (pyridoxamine 5'-phosphate oxidase superfamily)
VSELSSEFDSYLQDSRIPIRIASQSLSGWPVVISLWYFYQDGEIYCATKKTAKIVGYLESNPKCAYEIASDLPPYCGVRGQALARLDSGQGAEILDKLIQKYLDNDQNKLANFLQSNSSDEIAIILKPVNVFSWNFTERMQDVAPTMIELMEKSCP